jgi:hypothetical protein
MIGSVVIAAGFDADPVVGTWKLNLAKSTFAGIPHERWGALTLTFTLSTSPHAAISL